jgi:hypothetical protein
MAEIILTGTIFGVADVAPPSGFVTCTLTGSLVGSSDVQGGIPYRSMLFSGIIHGVGTLSMKETILSGSIFGTSHVDGALFRVRQVHGHIIGTSQLVFAEPLPIQCGCNVSAFLAVNKVPRPVCCKSTIRALRWGQSLQRGDLGVWLTQIGQGPIDPYRVTYALYQGLPGCVPKLIGPCERHPAHGNQGEYYATGILGDGGQPGRWRIVWRYQLTYGGPVYEEAMCLMVQDAIAAGHCPPTCTKQRGWF